MWRMSNCCGGNEEENMLTEEQILEALRPVTDPEIGMSVVDLGMIRQIVLSEAGEVEIKMILTTPFCPLASQLTEHVRQAATAVPGVKAAKVTLLHEPWDPSWARR
jgi:metal-sulfur cluster biosynthetic enzyme